MSVLKSSNPHFLSLNPQVKLQNMLQSLPTNFSSQSLPSNPSLQNFFDASLLYQNYPTSSNFADLLLALQAQNMWNQYSANNLALSNQLDLSSKNTPGIAKSSPNVINLEEDEEEEDCLIIEEIPKKANFEKQKSNFENSLSALNFLALQENNSNSEPLREQLTISDTNSFQSFRYPNQPINSQNLITLSEDTNRFPLFNSLGSYDMSQFKQWELGLAASGMMNDYGTHDRLKDIINESATNISNFKNANISKKIELIIIEDEPEFSSTANTEQFVSTALKQTEKTSTKLNKNSPRPEKILNTKGVMSRNKHQRKDLKMTECLNSKRSFEELDATQPKRKSIGRPKKQMENFDASDEGDDSDSIQIGTDFQAKLPPFILGTRKLIKREVKSVWNPESVQPDALENYFKELESITESEITNQEAQISLLKEFNLNIEKTLEKVGNDVLFYKRFFRIARKRGQNNYAGFKGKILP